MKTGFDVKISYEVLDAFVRYCRKDIPEATLVSIILDEEHETIRLRYRTDAGWVEIGEGQEWPIA